MSKDSRFAQIGDSAKIVVIGKIPLRLFRAQLTETVGLKEGAQTDHFYFRAKDFPKAREQAGLVASRILDVGIKDVTEVSEIPDDGPYIPTQNERLSAELHKHFSTG